MTTEFTQGKIEDFAAELAAVDWDEFTKGEIKDFSVELAALDWSDEDAVDALKSWVVFYLNDKPIEAAQTLTLHGRDFRLMEGFDIEGRPRIFIASKWREESDGIVAQVGSIDPDTGRIRGEGFICGLPNLDLILMTQAATTGMLPGEPEPWDRGE